MRTFKRTIRKMAWFLIPALIVLLVYILLAFKNGYRIPDIDKESSWKAFPEGSNQSISIKPVDSFYVCNLQAIPGTADYMVFYNTDSAGFYNSSNNSINNRFGIINQLGALKTSFAPDKTIYYDDTRIILLDMGSGGERKDSCSIYYLPTATLSQHPVQTIELPESLDHFLQKAPSDTTGFIQKHQSTFFRNLRGLQWFEEHPIYLGNQDRNRGYYLFTDTIGNIYRLSDSSSHYDLGLLAPQTVHYNLPASAFVSGVKGAGITIAHPPSLIDNDIRCGYTVGLGNPNGNGGGFYFFVNHTWLHYYKLRVGKAVTCFKEKGPEKDEAYIRLFQLNTPLNTHDPLVLVAANRIWHLTNQSAFR
ncbi:hypothetical protein HNQ91_005382 [Filimonas zeae]|nr:hypothetical protein [Filimonas zeae]MDR6342298.1 hypothetical protein [Filimonas zeae]